jgi:hypothetical protein
MRVLIAYEDSHRSYGEALLVGAFRGMRPGAEVSLVQVRDLGTEMGRFDPHLVVSGRPNGVDPGGRPACVTLSDELDRGGAAPLFTQPPRRWILRYSLKVH